MKPFCNTQVLLEYYNIQQEFQIRNVTKSSGGSTMKSQRLKYEWAPPGLKDAMLVNYVQC